MKCLSKGNYFGVHQQTWQTEGLILSDTEYTFPKVDWHYHENAYFTYLLRGKLRETGKKTDYRCTPGTLLFHHWQEAHYNIKEPGYARGFHIEFEKSWFEKHQLDPANFHGSFQIENSLIKSLLNKIYCETRLNDTASGLSIEMLLLRAFALISKSNSNVSGQPEWVKKLREILHEQYAEPLSLAFLAAETNLHPVYLSSEFSRWFGTNAGDYIRKIRLEKAVTMLACETISLSEIAYSCGFSDQSHFTRLFRDTNGITPLKFRKQISGKENAA